MRRSPARSLLCAGPGRTGNGAAAQTEPTPPRRRWTVAWRRNLESHRLEASPQDAPASPCGRAKLIECRLALRVDISVRAGRLRAPKHSHRGRIGNWFNSTHTISSRGTVLTEPATETWLIIGQWPGPYRPIERTIRCAVSHLRPAISDASFGSKQCPTTRPVPTRAGFTGLTLTRYAT